MRRDLMSRHHHRRVPSPTASSSAHTLDSPSAVADALFGAKSLTPQRKHHKLLKDGSEVWSEDVERIFVEGLKEYWDSPWATYSRGRSRWRNQFLVDHLKKYGIVRTKKQVASHIQVLRNMWRGEPEFHLVAGGEELFAENGLLASPKHKRTVSSSPSLSDSSPGPDSARESRSSASPSAPHPPLASSEYPARFSPTFTFPQHSPSDAFPSQPTRSYETFANADQEPYPMMPTRHVPRSSVKLEPLLVHPGLFNLPSVSPGHHVDALDLTSAYSMPHITNRFLGLSLWAEGMTPFMVDVDRLAMTAGLHQHPPTPSEDCSVLLRVRITMSSIDDILSSPNLHGLHGAVLLSERWSTEAKCITKIYTGSAVVHQEIGYFDAATASHSANEFMPHSISVNLPESALSRCRWLEKDQDTITQQIVVDGVVVAAFVFNLHRPPIGGSLPNAELVGFQRYKTPRHGRRPSTQQLLPSSPCASRSPPPGQGSPPHYVHPLFGPSPNGSQDFSAAPQQSMTGRPASLSSGFSYHSPGMFGPDTSPNRQDTFFVHGAPHSS